MPGNENTKSGILQGLFICRTSELNPRIVIQFSIANLGLDQPVSIIRTLMIQIIKDSDENFWKNWREVDLRKDEPGWSMPPLNRFR